MASGWTARWSGRSAWPGRQPVEVIQSLGPGPDSRTTLRPSEGAHQLQPIIGASEEATLLSQIGNPTITLRRWIAVSYWFCLFVCSVVLLCSMIFARIVCSSAWCLLSHVCLLDYLLICSCLLDSCRLILFAAWFVTCLFVCLLFVGMLFVWCFFIRLLVICSFDCLLSRVSMLASSICRVSYWLLVACLLLDEMLVSCFLVCC